jgi:hypothetical protein
MSLYSPESATLSIADPHDDLAVDPCAAVQTAIDKPSCRTAACPGWLANEGRKLAKLAIQWDFSCKFLECHDSYAAAPYRIFHKSPQTPLTTLSF